MIIYTHYRSRQNTGNGHLIVLPKFYSTRHDYQLLVIIVKTEITIVLIVVIVTLVINNSDNNRNNSNTVFNGSGLNV